MILLRTTVIFCCVFSLRANVAAEYYDTTIWNSFEWKMSIERRQQDEIILKGLLDDRLAQDEVKIPGATCTDVDKWTEVTNPDLPAFITYCKCYLNNSTFLPKLKRCVANSEVKKGCQFTTGSWRWSTSWMWDAKDDALIVLDDRGYGISTGFNAATTEYQSCSVLSISHWEENMNWREASDSFFNGSQPVMYKLHNMWHFSWNVETMNAEVKKSLKGKILKFLIECEKQGPPEDKDEELEITSCLVVKASGELTFTSKNWELLLNTTDETEAHATSATEDEDTLYIALFIPLALIILVIGVLTAMCYTRRAACFADRDNVHRVTVLDDDIAETKLIKNVANESVV